MPSILIAEDNQIVQNVLKDLLSSIGHNVYVADDGDEALKIAAESNLDLVILDIFMPNKEGLETLRELKNISPQTKVIAMSGNCFPNDYLLAAKAFGAEETIRKPFSNDELIELVRSTLN
jgi:two-component system, chemotaxis family, chemotaxis protein CheY